MNDINYFLSHRLCIAKALRERGNDVVIGYGYDKHSQVPAVPQLSFNTWPFPLTRSGTNVFKELRSVFYIWKLVKQTKADIIHCVSVKPYLYGPMIARVLGVPGVVSAVAGLGTIFIRRNFLNRLLLLLLYPLYRLAFSHPNQIAIFQNEDDYRVLDAWLGIDRNRTFLIKGVGVNLGEFQCLDEPSSVITICFAARLLKDKGVLDFVAAATTLKQRGVKARFWLAGDPDPGNPSSLSDTEVRAIASQGIVEVLGYTHHIPALYAQSHIVCLPSYREGFPKSLMEAAAAGRPVVTTDVPGCRDAVIPGRTGLLVPPGNPVKLADELQKLIQNPVMRVSMGRAARRLAESEFTISQVVEQHFEVYRQIMSQTRIPNRNLIA